MSTIQIKVANYYGKPSYYSVMPRAIFDALEAAALNGDEYTSVDDAAFNQMLADYQVKMSAR